MAEERLTRGATLVAAAAMLAVAATYAYFRAFSFYSVNDDEGYILQTIRSYLDGGRLFDDVFTQYGPGFYAFASLVHRTLGAPLTHDVERFVTIAMWVAASAAAAGTVLRLTRSSLAAGLTLIGVFIHLTPLIGEPGHPQGALVLVIALVTLAATWDHDGSLSPRQAIVAGVLTGFALLVKVNVGAYLAIGFGVPALLYSRLPRSRAMALLRLVVAGAACMLPLVVARNHVRGWAFNYIVVTCASLLATVAVLAWPRRTALPFAIVVRYTLAAAVSGAALLLPVLLRGTSVAALVTGVLVRPSQFDTVFFLPLVLPDSSLLAAGGGLALGAAWVVLAKTNRTPPPLLIALAKTLVAGAGLYLCRVGLGGQLSYFTPLLWVVALSPAAGSRSAPTVGRGILALVAVYQTLQAYPVAGSQLAFATVLMIPIAFVCAHDAWSIARRQLAPTPALSWAFQAVFALAGLAFYLPALHPLAWRGAYDIGYELRLRGAERLRVPAAEVARFQWLSATVAANCETLLTLPGLYSLNAWSGVRPPNGRNATTWMTLLTETEQQSIWTAVDGSPRACAVHNPALAANWLTGRVLADLPAHREMTTRFQSVAEVDGYQLLLRAADIGASGVRLQLVAGRQAFERQRSPLPILAALASGPATSTLRTWIKTTRTGVIVGCQSEAHAGLPSRRWLPMIYVGTTGKLYGQHWTADMRVQASDRNVNDGAWHHIVLVRDQNDQRLYIDGALAGATTAPIETDGLSSCQAGTGATSLWPDGPRGWMPFNGEIDGLEVALRAWSASDVADDFSRTRPPD